MAIFTVEDRVDWARWTLIAFNKAADAQKTADYPVYIEGDERTTMLLRNFAEVRLDGPDMKQVSKDVHYLDVTFNLLINSKISNNLYELEETLGNFQKAFSNGIDVYKNGNGDNDDDSLLGCYLLQDEIEVNKFGIIENDTRLTQATLEARYRMTL